MLVRFTNKTKMQSKQNNPIDTRSFPEIYNSLTNLQQQDLTVRFFNAGICTCRQAVWQWSRGTAPRQEISRQAVARILGNYIGAKLPVKTLFPNCK